MPFKHYFCNLTYNEFSECVDLLHCRDREKIAIVVKQSSQAHENLTQVLEQVENGYPQICNHQKTVTKTFTQ